jgi:hypothetical protein
MQGSPAVPYGTALVAGTRVQHARKSLVLQVLRGQGLGGLAGALSPASRLPPAGLGLTSSRSQQIGQTKSSSVRHVPPAALPLLPLSASSARGRLAPTLVQPLSDRRGAWPASLSAAKAADGVSAAVSGGPAPPRQARVLRGLDAVAAPLRPCGPGPASMDKGLPQVLEERPNNSSRVSWPRSCWARCTISHPLRAVNQA